MQTETGNTAPICQSKYGNIEICRSIVYNRKKWTDKIT